MDLILKQELKQVVDWDAIDKDAYLSAVKRSTVNDLELKYAFKSSLTDKIDDREVYMKGIDTIYYYEGYTEYRIDEL